MFFKQFLISASIALIVGVLFVLVSGRRQKREDSVWVLLIVWAGAWAGGLWLEPFGPYFWGIRPAPFAVAGAIFGILFLVIALRRPPSGRHETLEKLEQMEKEKKLQEATFETLKVVFFLILFLLIAAIITRYLMDI